MSGRTIAIIPARMGSSRFFGKPLAKIHSIPMVGHVYFRTCMCKMVNETYVATCDQDIYDYVRSIGGKVVMTSPKHERCSDRTAEAMLKIEAETAMETDIVVMVQGDEPMVTPKMIEEAITPLKENSTIQIVNLMSRMSSIDEFEDPNEVKVVVDIHDNALYFSREPIPSRKKGVAEVPMLKQVCVIPFRRNYLLKFNDMQSTPLEKIESVDMLRILEHGGQVHMVLTDISTVSVDTPSDLEEVARIMERDTLISSYCYQGKNE